MTKRTNAGPRLSRANIRMCCDRILSGPEKIAAMWAAIAEYEGNKPAPAENKRRLPGASSMQAPAKMALEAGKQWKPGRTLGVFFLEGSKIQRAQVKKYALQWSAFANIQFDFNATRSAAQIRITFDRQDGGSWSYIGTDCLGIPKTQATMNFGWLLDDTDEEEWRRVVVHEFGHALGAIHEHQNPSGGIQWNLPAVYAYFSGPPNNWSREDIDTNVIGKYSVDQLNASKFDGDSIMLYDFPGALIKGGKPTKFNTKWSAGDKKFIRKCYPAKVKSP